MTIYWVFLWLFFLYSLFFLLPLFKNFLLQVKLESYFCPNKLGSHCVTNGPEFFYSYCWHVPPSCQQTKLWLALALVCSSCLHDAIFGKFLTSCLVSSQRRRSLTTFFIKKSENWPPVVATLHASLEISVAKWGRCVSETLCKPGLWVWLLQRGGLGWS